MPAAGFLTGSSCQQALALTLRRRLPNLRANQASIRAMAQGQIALPGQPAQHAAASSGTPEPCRRRAATTPPHPSLAPCLVSYPSRVYSHHASVPAPLPACLQTWSISTAQAQARGLQGAAVTLSTKSWTSAACRPGSYVLATTGSVCTSGALAAVSGRQQSVGAQWVLEGGPGGAFYIRPKVGAGAGGVDGGKPLWGCEGICACMREAARSILFTHMWAAAPIRLTGSLLPIIIVHMIIVNLSQRVSAE